MLKYKYKEGLTGKPILNRIFSQYFPYRISLLEVFLKLIELEN